MSTPENTLGFPAADALTPDRPCPSLREGWTSLFAAFVIQAKRNPDKLLIVDNTGEQATFGEMLKLATGVALAIKDKVGSDEFIGILLPSSRAGMIANIAAAVLGKAVVNLNYSGGDAAINSAISQCNIKVVLSAKAFASRFKPDGELVYMEELQAPAITEGTTPDLPGLKTGLTDLAAVMFTSGSSGEPKGVELTNSNILHNLAQLAAHAHIADDERICGCLPYFHSYGLTVTLWAPAALGITVYAHNNPLSFGTMGSFVGDNKITVMASTPTFMRKYLRRSTKEQFSHCRILILGSEKLPKELRTDIQAQLGIDVCDGYGCTELSPLVSAGLPEEVSTPSGGKVSGNREGSVGQLLPGTRCAVVDTKTLEILPRGTAEGRIFIAGPQVMRGYRNKPAKTAEVLQNGWYYTGDIGRVDEDGFLYLTDRESRFAKVGPEMVPLIKVEARLRELAGVDESVMVLTAIPDETKGEKLVLLYTSDAIDPAALTKALLAEGMHSLWIPKTGDCYRVEGPFPYAAIGKLDQKAVKAMAVQLDAGNASSESAS